MHQGKVNILYMDGVYL
ncbi:H-X9-DG-CTERM domain-containing protein [Mucilaginibacter litoreus]|uniref:H-X9-DG-CTERM domain-containing protein n=1 Tax=Mucilaginibacter litoreus TaxID=1048221 RepID=A0ABW3AT08_9SPHI